MILAQQDEARVTELVPLRYTRMSASPLAFYRGAAAVMAHDLRSLPASGLAVQLCGDAHLLNFGGFASPERNLVFDVNDFDETLPGSFEWDLKRFATSLEIAGRERAFASSQRAAAVAEGVRTYRESMRQFAAMPDLDIWYSRLDADTALDEIRRAHDPRLAKELQRAVAKARANDGRRAVATLTRRVDGRLRIVSEPPLVVPLAEPEPWIEELLRGYRRSLASDRRVLFDRFRLVEAARKVVGIGSVGTRSWIFLFLGREEADPLFLQVKEAQASVLGAGGDANRGRRVVQGQRLMQASSDVLLGWGRAEVDGATRDFYVRQLRDWKASFDLETVRPRGLVSYARACGWTLARAHARSGDRVAIASYLGSGDSFDRAVYRFACAYADLNERDHRELVSRASGKPVRE